MFRFSEDFVYPEYGSLQVQVWQQGPAMGIVLVRHVIAVRKEAFPDQADTFAVAGQGAQAGEFH